MSEIETSAMRRINKNKMRAKGESSLWKDSWRRLMRNKMSVVGMVIIVFLLLLAIFADVITPYSYQEAGLHSHCPGA